MVANIHQPFRSDNLAELTDTDRAKIRAVMRGYIGADFISVGSGVIRVAGDEGWTHEKATLALHYALSPEAEEQAESELPLVSTGQGDYRVDITPEAFDFPSILQLAAYVTAPLFFIIAVGYTVSWFLAN